MIDGLGVSFTALVMTAIIEVIFSRNGFDLYLFQSVIAFGYLTWGYGSGQTIACKMLKLHVVNQQTGLAPGSKKGAVRTIVQILAGFMLGVGALVDDLWMLRNPRRQTIHDIAAGTQVLYRRRNAFQE